MKGGKQIPSMHVLPSGEARLHSPMCTESPTVTGRHRQHFFLGHRHVTALHEHKQASMSAPFSLCGGDEIG